MAVIVYYMYLKNEIMYTFDMFTTVEDLLEVYPEFTSMYLRPESSSTGELQVLLQFRNMMRVALTILEGKRNKQKLIQICSLLDGSDHIYRSGGYKSQYTPQRELIYAREHEYLNAPQECSSDSSADAVDMLDIRISARAGTLYRYRGQK
jgi:hypothetical protein